MLLVLTFRDASGARCTVGSLVGDSVLSFFVWTAFRKELGLQLVERFTWIGSFGIDYFLGLDGLNLFFLIATAWLQPLISSLLEYAGTSLAVGLHLLLLQCGVLGCFVAIDVILFYVFFELMLIPYIS